MYEEFYVIQFYFQYQDDVWMWSDKSPVNLHLWNTDIFRHEIPAYFNISQSVFDINIIGEKGKSNFKKHVYFQSSLYS